MTVCSRAGMPARRPIAMAATASGGATIAPKANAAANGSPGTTACITTPTSSAVARTRPTDSRPMDRAFARKSSRLASMAAL